MRPPQIRGTTNSGDTNEFRKQRRKTIKTTANISFSIASGLFGSIILAVFLSGVISAGKTADIMPLIIGFNGAVSGYKAVDLLKGSLRHLKTVGTIAGTAAGVLAWPVLNIVSFYAAGLFILTAGDLATFTAVSGMTGYLGSFTAVRYFQL